MDSTIFDIPQVATAVAPLLVSPVSAFSANAEMVVHSETPIQAVPTINKDQTDDYNYARTTIREVLEKAKTALDGIMGVASEDESARSYEVVSIMIKNISDVTKDLVNIHKTMHDMKPKDHGPPGATNIIDKAVFVGNPSDLLNSVRYRDGKP